MDVSWAAGPIYSLALLVAAAGVVKLGRPVSAAGALRAANLPAPQGAIRVLGALEIGLGVFVLTVGSTLATLVLASVYLAFALFSVRLLVARGSKVPCGCFGETSAPTSPIHVAVNVAAFAICVAAAAVGSPPGALTEVFAGQVVAGVAFVAAVLTATWAWYAALVLLPELMAAGAEADAEAAA